MRIVFSLSLALLVQATVCAAPNGPPYYDPDRSMDKQKTAAKEAVATCASGGASEIVPFFVDPSARVRDDVLRALVQRNDKDLLAAMAKGLTSRDEFVAGTVAELYGLCGYAEGREDLEKALKGKSELAVLEAIWALEALGSAESGKALEKTHKRKHSASEYRVQGDALIALAVCDVERARPLIAKALGNKKHPFQIAGLMALQRISPREAAQAAVDVVLAKQAPKSQRAWEARVLFTAIECFANWHKRSEDAELCGKAIGALIARLEREEALAKHMVGEALRDLSGEPIGDDHLMWQGWWDARKDAFKPVDKVVKEEPKRKSKKQGGEEEKKKKEPVELTTRVRFHGIPIYSNRMLFAQDISGGMSREKIVSKDESSPTRMKFSVDELKRVLGKLDDDVMTNIVFFATEYFATAETLFPIKRARKQLLTFVAEKSVTPKGKGLYRSNLYDTLVFALNDPEIDTVYFLSEGGPSEGRYLRTDRFMSHLRRLNVYRRVQVHTLQVSDTPTGRKFLSALSETTGAQYYGLDFLRKAKGS